MYPGEFEELFKKVSKVFTLETVAKNRQIQGKLLNRNPETPLWDTIEHIKGFDGIDIGDGKFVSCEHFFKKPIRILFFILIHEFESRLYRINRRNGRPIEELDEKNVNDLIRELLENESLISLQDIYKSRAQFKDDLKAISAFRNLIVHTNRKLLKSVGSETLIERKKQILMVLEALQQISDRMERKDAP
ncbi:MAG: hypothetical protein PHH00_04045 [Candidatus Nanoarchaeia archaeon]|nr:hypothetical protein [Candidatus Nanoarchaeia archaeon]